MISIFKKIKYLLKNHKIIISIIIFLVCQLLIFFPFLKTFASTISTAVTIIDPKGAYVIITAIPEKRIANAFEGVTFNLSTILKIKFYVQGSDRTNPTNLVYEKTVTSSDSGIYNAIQLVGVPYGTYDVTVKGYSHLTRLVSNVVVASPYITPIFSLDFTDEGNLPLYSGDINSENGDDKINALDISVLLNSWGQSNVKSDLNRDNEVNAFDISVLLNNFNRIGD